MYRKLQHVNLPLNAFLTKLSTFSPLPEIRPHPSTTLNVPRALSVARPPPSLMATSAAGSPPQKEKGAMKTLRYQSRARVSPPSLLVLSCPSFIQWSVGRSANFMASRWECEENRRISDRAERAMTGMGSGGEKEGGHGASSCPVRSLGPPSPSLPLRPR